MNQVVVVGAGPTGVTLALLLVKQGISVTLIEAARDFKRIFRGEGLMPSGLNALQEMGLLSLVKDIPHTKLDAWEFFLNQRSLMRINEPLETGEMPCTLVSQPHFLAEVVKKASNYPNFTFIQGEAVQELLRDEQERVCGVRLGKRQEVKANLVVAADGRNSLVRKQAGLELERFSSAIDILWFKLSAGSLLQSENIFASILQDRSGFALFRGSEGELQIGWGLHKDDDYDWKQVDWKHKLAAASPEWLAKHIEDESTEISQPLLLSVVVGRCPQWYKPGLLLLGDAVHPMSPIRAQGINMAFRDVIVASNYLIPELVRNSDCQVLNALLDAVLPKIQAEREPEIIRIQQLQDEELAQAEKLRHSALLRSLVSQYASLIRPLIRFSWLKRQKILRQGIRKIRLLSTVSFHSP
jgi:2-polyprenyl-6-methoxyphenol hydroxylase-like FAD-dependent oxidoreductase